MAGTLAIGIDIGGTKMSVGVVDAAGRILGRAALPTEAGLGFDRAVDRLGATIDTQLAALGASRDALVGIGVGCAGPLDPLTGCINNPYTLEGWLRCDIVTPLRQRFRVPAYLENDADVAALGECWIGAGVGHDPVVMLTFGTGIGGAIIRAGAIVRGVNGEHPELGHLPVRDDGPECYCGTRGCLESLASGTALALRGGEAGFTSAREVFKAADRGHTQASVIVEGAVNAAGSALWAIFHTILPSRVILGGGIMETEFARFEPAIRKLDRVTQFTRSAVSVVPAVLGNDAGLVGAARVAWLGHTLPSVRTATVGN